jgi:radical SAM superfamily enzyme with C-terminal helix-hairpin-helix motif
VDGYVDEPTVLGVPPYLSMYPRYIAGAIWQSDSHAEILYTTIDQVRRSFDRAIEVWSTCDLVVLIAGMIVPGKYIGGTPISIRETKTLLSDSRLESTPTILVGPWANFGCGIEGGKIALSSKSLSPPIDFIVPGDPEMILSGIAKANWSVEDGISDLTSATPSQIRDFAILGASIVKQHPGLSKGYLITEIESYRGCPRFITGGCSFCTEPLYGPPQQRPINDIVNEVEALYSAGIRAFRIGKQADLFTYGSDEMGEEEFPTPNPEAIDELFSKIRLVAPALDVLHIDNVNPGTIARHPEESRAVAKVILKHHTCGDVAAFGVESLDPEVIKRNNLKATPDEVLRATRILNEIGGVRGQWSLPHLLPGINLLYGLPGETGRTIEYNMEFLRMLVREGLVVRRINIRQVIGFEGTRLGVKDKSKLKRNLFFKHKEQVRKEIDTEMIKRVAPSGTILRNLFIEHQEGNSYLLRQLGTYPLLCHMPVGQEFTDRSDVIVIDHGPRSLTVLPYPFRVNHASLTQWKAVPGIGAKRAARIKGRSSYSGIGELEMQLDSHLPEWMSHALDFS